MQKVTALFHQSVAENQGSQNVPLRASEGADPAVVAMALSDEVASGEGMEDPAFNESMLCHSIE